MQCSANTYARPNIGLHMGHAWAAVYVDLGNLHYTSHLHECAGTHTAVHAGERGCHAAGADSCRDRWQLEAEQNLRARVAGAGVVLIATPRRVGWQAAGRRRRMGAMLAPPRGIGG